MPTILPIRKRLHGKMGYDIICDEAFPENPAGIVIAMHGFAGDRTSRAIALLRSAVTERGFGIISFDWPAHGESPTDELSVRACLSDLETVVTSVKGRYPGLPLTAFGTSFGGYLTLLYHHLHPGTFGKVILRAPAIRMYHSLRQNIMSAEDLAALDRDGSYRFGYERILTVTRDFLAELQTNDLDRLYGDRPCPEIFIIHGTADEIAPFEYSRDFSQRHGSELYPIDGAGHRFLNPGELPEVIDRAVSILNLCDRHPQAGNGTSG